MITCPRCAQALPGWLFRDTYIESMCPHCQSALEVYSFPALFRAAEKLDTTQGTLDVGDSSCYEHPSRKAAAICSNCGRFLCSLCEVQLGTDILCPDCVQGQRAKAYSTVLATQRTKFDSIALALATWPLFVFYLTIFTAPASIGIALYGWNRPSSIVRRSRWRLFTALGLSALELAGMVALIFALVYGSRRATN